MNEQASAGWYPDGQGNERYWDGVVWTEQLRVPSVGDTAHGGPKKDGAFGKFGGMVKKAAADRKAAKEEIARRQAEDAHRAGTLITSGVFGTSTVEIYENGYVRVASWGDGTSPSGPKSIDKNTPFEKLRSIKFNSPDQGRSSGEGPALAGTLGTAVTGLLKGGKALAKVSPTGLVVTAATSYIASAATGKSFLTITTDKQIHTLTNQSANSVGFKVSNKAHNDVGFALEAAGNAVLGLDAIPSLAVASGAEAPAIQPAAVAQAAAAPSLSDRLRELASLHAEGILSDDEFAAAKAQLLSGI